MAKGSALADMGKLVIGGVAVGLAVNYISKHASAHFHAQTRALKLQIASVAIEGANVVINIRILNPNSESMEVQSFIGTMSAGGRVVADIQMFGDYIAKGNSEITIPLVAQPKTRNLMQEWQALWSRPKVPIRFAGTVNVNNKAIPLTLSYNN